MFRTEYREEMEQIMLSDEKRQAIAAAMVSVPVRRVRHTLRAAVAAAVVCALVVLTAAAYCMGAFEFLKERDEYAYLGMNEIYETYAQPVGQSVTAENGDVITVDRVAMDGKFCTIFYSVRFREPVVAAELEQLQAAKRDDWLLVSEYTPEFYLYAGGEEISLEGYNNSFEPQSYLADEYTVYGAWRILLRRPLAEGEEVQLRGGSFERDGGGEWRRVWDFTLDFTAYPVQGERYEPDVTFQARIQGRPVQLEVVSLERSALGTLLTIRGEDTLFDTYSIDFVLRDGDTGAYIPFAEVVTSHQTDPEGYHDNTYELFGDVSGLETLELIPTRRTGSVSPQKRVALSDLPCLDAGNPDGGYAPASYWAENGQLIVEMKPVGAANGAYASLANGVHFLDEEGNDLFGSICVDKIKNRSDGTITVISTPDPEAYQRDVDKVAQIWFFVEQYDVLEEQKVDILLR